MPDQIAEPNPLETVWLSEEYIVNTTRKHAQNGADIITLDDGRLLVSFHNGGFIFHTSINFRFVDTLENGALSFSSELSVTEPTDSAPYDPEVLQLPDQRLLFTYVRPYADGSASGIVGRIGVLNDDGTAEFGDEFAVNEHTYHGQNYQKMILLSDGRVLFHFETQSGVDGDESFGGISARIGTINENNSVTFGEEFRVNENTYLQQWDAQVVQLQDGRVLFLYLTNAGDIPNTLVARIGSPDDTESMSLDGEFVVADVGYQAEPSVYRLEDGRILIAYISKRGFETPDVHDDVSNLIVRLMTVNEDGSVSFQQEAVVDDQLRTSGNLLEMTQMADGRFLFVFETVDPSTNIENSPIYYTWGGIVGRIVELLPDGSLEVSEAFRLNPHANDEPFNDLLLTPLADGNVLLTHTAQRPGDDGTFTSDVVTRVLELNGAGTAGDDTLVATSYSNGLFGLAGDDILIGGNGAELFDGGTGSDLIDGNAGNDTVVYRFSRANVIIEDLPDGSVSVTEPDGSIDRLYDIERIELLDGNLIFDMDSQNLGFTYRIYSAGYGRTPDEGGLRYWTGIMDYLDADFPYVDKHLFLAQQFLHAEEYIDLYSANPSNEQYVGDLYVNVLGRLPDQEGYDFWVWVMEYGYSREDLLIYFAESIENTEKTAPDLGADGVWVF